nr:alpha/beta fold hydrolase [Thermoleophilaceae bacterium]
FLNNPLVKRSNALLMRESKLAQRTAAHIAARPRLRKAAIRWTTKHPERLSGAICVELIRGGGCPGGASATASLAAHDFRSKMPDIECPTLIVWGENDLVVAPVCAERYAERIPDSRLVVFEDTGHLPMIERPGRFLAELESFLDASS